MMTSLFHLRAETNREVGFSRISYGQLATELFVTPLPQLRIRPLMNEVEISWPTSRTGVVVESTFHLGPMAFCSPLNDASQTNDTWKRLDLPKKSVAQRFFRLRVEAL